MVERQTGNLPAPPINLLVKKTPRRRLTVAMLGAVINLVRRLRFFTAVEVQFEKRPTAGRVELCSNVTALILGPETKHFFT